MGWSREDFGCVGTLDGGLPRVRIPQDPRGLFAKLVYASAYMRTHYPAEFFCGILNSQPIGFFSPRTVLNEARRIGLAVLPPDVRSSGEGFAVEGDGSALRVGFSYCKGISAKAISSVISEREGKPFASVADLYRRTAVERDSVENLTKGGFLDVLANGSGGRARLLSGVRELPKKRRRHDEAQPEMPLGHPATWWEEREGKEQPAHLPLAETGLERMEWEVLRLNVRRHPLSPYRRAFRDLGVTPSEDAKRLPHATRARAAGLVECLQRPPTRSGVPVYFLQIEDEWGLLQATTSVPSTRGTETSSTIGGLSSWKAGWSGIRGAGSPSSSSA